MDSIEPKIIGGYSVDIEYVPYQVSVHLKNIICGGTILKKNVIVTAGHCTNKPKGLRQAALIRAGSSYHNKGGVVIRVKQIYDHPNFNPAVNLDYDIAILQLLSNLHFSSTVEPINIASYLRKNNDLCLVSGWGVTKVGGKASGILQYIVVPFIDSKTCAEWSDYTWGKITKNMVCAGFIQIDGYDHCNGDSGGPLVHDNELIGIVSWARGCASIGYPGVYTNVFQLRDWIEDTLNKINLTTVY